MKKMTEKIEAPEAMLETPHNVPPGSFQEGERVEGLYAIRATRSPGFRRGGQMFHENEWTVVENPLKSQIDEPLLTVVAADDPEFQKKIGPLKIGNQELLPDYTAMTPAQRLAEVTEDYGKVVAERDDLLRNAESAADKINTQSDEISNLREENADLKAENAKLLAKVESAEGDLENERAAHGVTLRDLDEVRTKALTPVATAPVSGEPKVVEDPAREDARPDKSPTGVPEGGFPSPIPAEEAGKQGEKVTGKTLVPDEGKMAKEARETGNKK